MSLIAAVFFIIAFAYTRV